MLKSKVKVKGKVHLTLRRGGRTVLEHRGNNIVTTAGLAAIAALLNAGTAKPTHIALGDSEAALAASQTALQGSQHGSRVAATVANSGAEITLTGTFTAGAQIEVKEIGIFSAAAAGTMFARFLPSTFTMDTNDQLDIEWALEFI